MSSLYDNVVTVLNKRNVDMIHDIENEYDQDENDEKIGKENNKEIKHDETFCRPKKRANKHDKSI